MAEVRDSSGGRIGAGGHGISPLRRQLRSASTEPRQRRVEGKGLSGG
jgi:hypothetical protein